MEKYKRGEVALSTFNFLFSELISYLSKKDNLQENLKKIGSEMGFRLYNLIATRQNINERENRILPMIRLVQGSVFKYLFGKEADKLSVFNADGKNLYVIRDNTPVILKYVPEQQNLECSVFVAGIIEAMLCAAGFECEVTSQTAKDQDGESRYPETQYLISFKDQVEKKYKLE